MRRLLSVVLTMTLILLSANTALAAVPESSEIVPMYNYIQTYDACLTIDEDTAVATCEASCYTVSGCTVEIESKLQYNAAGSWVTLKTWTDTGSRYAGIYETRVVVSGFTYRLRTTYFVYNSAGSLVESTNVTRTYVYPPQNT